MSVYFFRWYVHTSCALFFPAVLSTYSFQVFIFISNPIILNITPLPDKALTKSIFLIIWTDGSYITSESFVVIFYLTVSWIRDIRDLMVWVISAGTWMQSGSHSDVNVDVNESCQESLPQEAGSCFRELADICASPVKRGTGGTTHLLGALFWTCAKKRPSHNNRSP